MENFRSTLAGVALLAGMLPRPAAAQSQLTQQHYQADFEFFWQTVYDEYAYLGQKQTNWQQAHALYRPQADTISSRRAFIRLLETMLLEIYDNHAGLATNRPDSPRLIPSGSDIHAEFVDGKALVLDVRPGFGAEKAGLRPGMEVVAAGGRPVEQAMQPFVGRTLRQADAAVRNYALNVLLAGTHDAERHFTVRDQGQLRELYPDRPAMLLENVRYNGLLESRRYGRVGYLKINNSLFDNGLIPAFDEALTSLQDTKALILDLRETPNGGNTTVARAILGRFITQEQYYQKHELPNEGTQYGAPRQWAEIVAPRPNPYKRPVILLVGPWTASMGEGITIAFDALGRGQVVGSAMARLHGAIYSYKLPHSRIGFNLPVEKLYHLNGTPREKYVPAVLLNPQQPAAGLTPDAALNAALRRLQ